MRTTIRLDDSLIRQAKTLAARTGRTLTAVIEDALRAALARPEPRKEKRKITFVTFKGAGLMPGIDLDDTASLLDAMEEPRAPR